MKKRKNILKKHLKKFKISPKAHDAFHANKIRQPFRSTPSVIERTNRENIVQAKIKTMKL